MPKDDCIETNITGYMHYNNGTAVPSSRCIDRDSKHFGAIQDRYIIVKNNTLFLERFDKRNSMKWETPDHEHIFDCYPLGYDIVILQSRIGVIYCYRMFDINLKELSKIELYMTYRAIACPKSQCVIFLMYEINSVYALTKTGSINVLHRMECFRNTVVYCPITRNLTCKSHNPESKQWTIKYDYGDPECCIAIRGIVFDDIAGFQHRIFAKSKKEDIARLQGVVGGKIIFASCDAIVMLKTIAVDNYEVTINTFDEIPEPKKNIRGLSTNCDKLILKYDNEVIVYAGSRFEPIAVYRRHCCTNSYGCRCTSCMVFRGKIRISKCFPYSYHSHVEEIIKQISSVPDVIVNIVMGY